MGVPRKKKTKNITQGPSRRRPQGAGPTRLGRGKTWGFKGTRLSLNPVPPIEAALVWGAKRVAVVAWVAGKLSYLRHESYKGDTQSRPEPKENKALGGQGLGG